MESTKPTEHHPALVCFGDRHSTPTEVCWACSNEEEGIWVPVTQCPEAKSVMTEGPGSSYAWSIVIERNREEET